MTDQQLIAQLLGALTRLKIEITLSDIDMAYIESHFRPHLNVAEEAIAATEGRMPNVYSIAAAEAREGGEVKPLAWIWQFEDGDFYEDPFGSKEECERNAAGYDGEAIPLCRNQPDTRSQAVIAMLEEAEAALRGAGCDVTADKVRALLAKGDV